ncbi:MAG: addiction module toxin RelE, partial [Vicinamibacteria bacterium]
MSQAEPFQLVYDREVLTHLKSIERKFYLLIRDTIKEQLSFEPAEETRNRKPLKIPTALGGVWELRFGPDNRFRVFYRVDASRHEV